MVISCVEFCKALADETRQEILRMLQEREMYVSDIVEALDKEQPTISHHLNVLKRAGLVKSRREGKYICYCIDRENLTECCGMLVARFSPEKGEAA
ncbi:MAG: ArsR/SmtB family transcription factor [Anaerolineae bacterium]